MSAKSQSDAIIIIPNLVASWLHGIWRKDVLFLGEQKPLATRMVTPNLSPLESSNKCYTAFQTSYTPLCWIITPFVLWKFSINVTGDTLFYTNL